MKNVAVLNIQSLREASRDPLESVFIFHVNLHLPNSALTFQLLLAKFIWRFSFLSLFCHLKVKMWSCFYFPLLVFLEVYLSRIMKTAWTSAVWGSSSRLQTISFWTMQCLTFQEVCISLGQRATASLQLAKCGPKNTNSFVLFIYRSNLFCAPRSRTQFNLLD